VLAEANPGQQALRVLAYLRKGETFADRPCYSGKHPRIGMNLQVISSPGGGDIVWVSGTPRGATHNLRAARIWGIIRGVIGSQRIR
jgi:hypothetical protein